MPIILSQANTGNMTNEELLETALKTYANEDNWESYEKDFGDGRMGRVSPWTFRDQGNHAREALKMVAERRAAGVK